jgi:neutral ceramidase
MADSPALLAGCAKVDITPPLHVPYLGFDPRQDTFEGVHDPLFARAAVFSSGDSHVAAVSADALGLSTDLFGPGRDFVAEVRERAAVGTNLPPDHILVAATHAHSTPETYGITRLWERDDCVAWIETLADQLASAVRLAWSDRRPAQLTAAITSLRGMSRNRRDEVGPLDEQLAVLLAERDDAGSVVLANFACHPVTVQVQPLISADFPGAGTAIVERELGDGSTCLFLQGAAGDINPIRGNSFDWRDVETYGLMLAGATLEAIGAARLAEPCADPIVASASETLTLAAREAPSLDEAAATLAEAEQALAPLAKDHPERAKVYGRVRMARETYRLAQFGGEPVRAEVQALRLGDVAIAAFAGELFCALGQRVKQASCAPLTMVAECANGCLGYLAPREAWERGGYEVGPGAWCRVAAGGPETMVERAAGLIEGLFAPPGAGP